MQKRFGATLTAVITTLAVLVGVLALVAAPANAAAPDRAPGASTSTYYSMINNLRTSRGLAPLTIDSALAASAQSWAGHMSTTDTLAHDPALGSAVTGWSKIGENVGMGPSADLIWAAFIASPGHLSNLLDPAFTHMGVGVVTNGPKEWTTHRFMARAGSVTPPPTAPPTTAAPVVTAPPATAPPATVPPNPGDSVDCTSFSGWAEANQWFVHYKPHYGDVALLDPDYDGIPCETSPGAPYQPAPAPVAPAASAPVYPSSTGSTTAGAADSTGAGSGSGAEATSNGAGGATGGTSDGSGSGSDAAISSISAEASADPDRVAEVISALRAIES